MPSKQQVAIEKIKGKVAKTGVIFDQSLAEISQEIINLKKLLIVTNQSINTTLSNRISEAKLEALVAKQAADRGLARQDQILVSNSLANVAIVLNNAETNSMPASYLNNVFSLADSSAILNDPSLDVSKRNSILNHVNMLPDTEQDILEQMVNDEYYDSLLNILTSSADDNTISNNTTLTDVHIYKTLTINNGVTLTLNTTTDEKPAILFVKNLVNNGTITRTPEKDANGKFLRTSAGHVSGAGGNGGNYGNDVYDGSGGGRDGQGYHYGVAGSASYTLKTVNELIQIILKGSFKAFIEDEQSKGALTTPYTLPDMFGADSSQGYDWNGGGSILIYAENLINTGIIRANGQSSGQGGEIIIKTTTLNNTGTIETNGGNGGTTTYTGHGGGGGGLLYIFYTTLTAQGTVQATGGTGGIKAGYNGTNGAAGDCILTQV